MNIDQEKLTALALIAFAGFAAVILWYYDKIPAFVSSFPLSAGSERMPESTVGTGDIQQSGFPLTEIVPFAEVPLGWYGGVA